MESQPLKSNAFVQKEIPMTRDNFTYLGIKEGPQTRLVLAWSPSEVMSNLFMVVVRALDRLVGSANVQDYRIAMDPAHSFAFILCPDDVTAETLRARYVTVGDYKFFFDLVKSVHYMPFYDDINQHPRVSKWI